MYFWSGHNQSTKAGGKIAPAFFLSQEFLFKKIFSCLYKYKTD